LELLMWTQFFSLVAWAASLTIATSGFSTHILGGWPPGSSPVSLPGSNLRAAPTVPRRT